MIEPQKRKACKDTTSVSQNEDDHKQCEETIMKGEVDTKTQRDDVPVQRVIETEKVAHKLSEKMEKEMPEKRRLKLKAKRIERRNQPMLNKIKSEMNWVLERMSAKIAESGIESARARAAAETAAAAAEIALAETALAEAALSEAAATATLPPRTSPPAIKIIPRRTGGEGARTPNEHTSGLIRGKSRTRPPYVNPANRPPPDRDKTRRVPHDKGCRTDQDKTPKT